MRLVHLPFAFLVFSASSSGQAQITGTIDDYDSREVAMLPRYCIHTQIFRDRVPGGNNQSEVARWYATMGPIFHAMHHYCWGLMKTNRAIYMAKTKQDREFYLRSSVVEFDYVLDRAAKDFALRPEILTKKGENLLRLRNVSDGINQLMAAIAAKPDYWPPYAALSDYYKDSGNLREAREWLERGLQAAPNTAALTNRLKRLDSGKPSSKAGTGASKTE